jgi:hypothetical protein
VRLSRCRASRRSTEPRGSRPEREPEPQPQPEPELKPAASASAASGGPEAGLPADPADWAGVRRALRALGVSRYGVEGEPAGRVRFHCVLPLAGRRAVGQHFEAEGDDDLQAARAALRRVTLWRASEGGELCVNGGVLSREHCGPAGRPERLVGTTI